MSKKFVSNITNYSYYLIMFFLPLSLKMDNIFLAIMFISVFLNNKRIKTSNLQFYFLAFCSFTFLNGVLNNFFIEEKDNFLRLLPLIFVPFCLKNISYKTKIKGLYFLLIAIIVIQLNSIYGIINYYYFIEGKKYALKNYSKVNEILNYERPYLGFFSALNIVISFYLFNKKKWLSITIAISSLLLIIIISARLAIIVVFFTVLIALLSKLTKRNILITITIMLGAFIFMVFSKSSLNERFKQISKDARVITWKGASNIFVNNSKYILGSGSETNTRKNLLEHYKNYKGFSSDAEKKRFIKKNYNTHNQYINELLRGGILGFVLFLLPQIVLFIKSIKTKNTLSIMFLVSIFSFSFVENILDRQIGVYLFAILLSLTNVTYKAKE